MKIYTNPTQADLDKALKRGTADLEQIEPLVKNIIGQVKSDGDKALTRFAKEYDKVQLDQLFVSADQIKKAKNETPEELKKAIQVAIENVKTFHASQNEPIKKVETQPGVTCWRKSVPIEKVGLYIPGGSAPLFSSLIMLAVPAKVAGAKEIVICTPPNKNGEVEASIRYVADLLEIETIYSVGGAGAIAAMAYGTETIPKVDKIFGPGNQYVTVAKQLVSSSTAIDMPAGPSEVLIIADESCNPEFVAADLLSQAEHGSDSQVIFISDSESVINDVSKELYAQLDKLPRKEIAERALENSSAIKVLSINQAIQISNEYAPEHLIIAVKNLETVSNEVTNAGSVFLGNYSCESAGDYASGTNHTLPTNGYARSFSGVSLDSFMKKITFQELTSEGIKSIGKYVTCMAEAENLEAHANAMRIRLESVTK